MGFETANLHLGTPGARARILQSLRSQDRDWLHHASKVTAEAVTRDWKEWRAATTP
jgi:hypothetical protein